ncbi:MAG: CBS domain-containing protein [Phycisphaerales bacterium]|nr:CBS domain-containing protein [Phycisphaerales bacterium]
MTNISKVGDIAFFGRGDEGYFEDDSKRSVRGFDAHLLQEPISVLATRAPLIFSENTATSTAMRAMQSEHSGVVLITPDGSAQTPLVGIFTERDILLRVINRGRNPAETPLSEMMSADLEVLQSDARLAWVLNMMSVGGFRHVPIVNSQGHPVAVVSVRDIVEFLVSSFPNQILNLPPDFGVKRHLPREGA